MLRALNGVLADVAARDDVRCVILHGGDARAFCAGSDIKEFDGSARRRERAQDPVRGHGAAPSRAHADADDRRHRRPGAGRRLRARARVRPARPAARRRAGSHRVAPRGLGGQRLGASDAPGRPRAREGAAVHRRNDRRPTGAWRGGSSIGSLPTARRSTAHARWRPRSPRAARCRTGSPRSSSTRRRIVPLDAALVDVDDRAAADLRQRRPARRRGRVLREARCREFRGR